MKTTHFLYLSILFFALSSFLMTFTGTIKDEKIGAKRAQEVFLKKEALLKKNILIVHESGFVIDEEPDREIEDQGISVFAYRKDSLVYWSNNNIPIASIHFDTIKNNSRLTILHNSYYCLTDTKDSILFVGMVHLSSSYPYQNKFLRNGLDPDFHLVDGVRIVSESGEKTYPIVNADGNTVFFLDFSNANTVSHIGSRLFATVFFFVGLFFLLNLFRLLLKLRAGRKGSYLLFYIFIGLILGRWLLMFTGVLNNRLLLFDPYIYASKLAPSLGDLILNTILFVFITYLLNRFVRLPEKYIKYPHNLKAWVGILNIVFLLSLLYAYFSSVSLISNSSFDIVVHNISQLEIPVVLSYVIFAMNYLGVVLVILWVIKTLENVQLYKLIINSGVLLACLYLLSIFLKSPVDIYTIVFAFVLYLQTAYLRDKLGQSSILSSLVVFLLVFAIYIMLFTVHLSEKKDFLQDKSLAISLSSEHDPIAEYLFKDISEELENDTVVINALSPDRFDIDKLYNYLVKSYFNGYWKKYDTKITVCRPQDSVLVNGNILYWYPCYDFFYELVENNGLKIPNSDFYYIDKYTGLINYLGKISYKLDRNTEISLFLELDSKLTTKPLGYPELLLDEGLQSQNNTLDISYAKYHKGQLISHSGKYEYSLISKVFQDTSFTTFRKVAHNNYEHLVYQPNDETIVIISEPEVDYIDYLVLFSYVFVFYYLLSVLIILLFVSQYRHISFRDSLKNRIQFSVISILIASLVLIAGSTTWFNIRKYNQTQFRILEEKINSVYVELEHKLAFEDYLSPDWQADKYDNLEQLLVKFSEVFYSDINLYDPNGNLLASSRNEVFQLGLQSKKMEPLAYKKMSEEKLARFVHREKISKLAYLSAYVPFINNQGELLAYLNLPYFTKQKELQEEITTLTVAIINIYVLLILITIVIAVVISDQITKPLEMIEDRFRGLKLGSKHEPIEYLRNDEIGRLVKQYNKMVQELEKNIQLLAKSERESAWREMAKQVAHEIKNPLTPMRLSVQQLQRSWDDKKEGFDKYLSRVTETLIEQIDNLSNIANEFSNFAIMPMAEIREVDINDALKNAVSLFDAQKNVKVNLHSKEQKVWVMADSDQLNRVFINIVKNGIQSIPDSREGEVNITLTVAGKKAVIEFKDNGRGIPDEIKDKLFTPNFTTKSGGMGLGLAIVKNILESIGGSINFSTQINKGTMFSVVLPVIDK